MGVAGCGKSTIGAALAEAVGGRFLDGDAYHPQSNIEKMSRGEPLSDDDRWPWLERFAREMAARDGIVVGGCSALKRAYRERIADTAKQTVLFVHLSGSRELIAGRMKERTGHFMPQSLLDSQFAALETPTTDENAIAVDIDAPIERIIEEIVSQMEPETRPPSSGPSGHLLPPGEKG